LVDACTSGSWTPIWPDACSDPIEEEASVDANDGAVPSADATQDTPERRCWRCMTMFSCTAAQAEVGATQWWLCDACQSTLIGSNQGTAR